MNDLGTFVSRVKSVTKIIEGIRNEIKKELNSYDSALKAVRDEKSDLFLTPLSVLTRSGLIFYKFCPATCPTSCPPSRLPSSHTTHTPHPHRITSKPSPKYLFL